MRLLSHAFTLQPLVSLSGRQTDPIRHATDQNTEQGFFDDTSLLTNHVQGTEFIPGDFSAWLDANASDLASMLPSNYLPGTTNTFEQSDTTPTTQAAPPNLNGHVEDYFNQGWPK